MITFFFDFFHQLSDTVKFSYIHLLIEKDSFYNITPTGMDYFETFSHLQGITERMNAKVSFDSIEMHKHEFVSNSYNLLPGVNNYHCFEHDITFTDIHPFYSEIGTIKGGVHIKDIEVQENQRFNYYVMHPAGTDKAKNVLFLFHGFNEKDWNKYLPWAKSICDQTGHSIVLFPISFHMDRAPKLWSSKREMFQLSKDRQKRFPNVVNSTLSNVAISMRLHSMPQRFIWSGLQTYFDILQFIDECKQGMHDHIDKDFHFDIFAYSIGGFLAQILKFSNYNDFFSNTKICLFCTGATFNRLSPVSKFILDSETNVALYSFFIEHFDKMLENDAHLNHHINENHLEGKVFYSMLDFKKMRTYREELLKKYEKQIYAITLSKDEVIPSFEIVNTLQGAYRNIGITVDEFDFDYSYTHENIFPQNAKDAEEINSSFNKIFELFSNYIKS